MTYNLTVMKLTYLVGGGIITHLLQGELPMTPICPINLSNRERKLLNSDLTTTYKVVVVGFISAFTTFIAEVIYRFCKSKTSIEKKSTIGVTVIRENEKNSINNLLFTNDPTSKTTLSDDFVISQYYKELMPTRYTEYLSDRNKNVGLIVPNTHSNLLFRYNN